MRLARVFINQVPRRAGVIYDLRIGWRKRKRERKKKEK